MAERTELIPIYIMGKRYDVPASLTIMKAMEWAGYTLVRGVGCRGGFCGACATVYRIKDDPKLYFGLACQTVVQPEMYLGQIPFFPAKRAVYDITQMQPVAATLFTTYPELLRCLGCGTCTKACPQELNVKGYMAAAMRGDIAAVANMSFDCIMCGLCAARCPAEEPQYNVAILARRLYGRYLAPHSQHLAQRVAEIQEGQFDAELAGLKSLDANALKEQYKARQIEA
ncbi:MAG: 4Fe-4S dicluster domain-containing protein [Anaerolineales bacterium]|nr:4Fe-4S dicluster domain-containing protein [Anaerolineales bacterium]MDD5467178.1 4Fe-4S dicluster domain-containing protein [Anaerolineales bacterium]